MLQASGPPKDPNEGGPDDEDEQKGPADAAKQGPEGGQAAAVVDQGDAEGEEDPAGHVVADAGSQDGDADTGAEQVQLAENAAEHGEGGDGERGADEQAVDAEAYGRLDEVGVELVVDTPSDGEAQAEGDDHAGQADAQGGFPVLGEQPDVDLFAS